MPATITTSGNCIEFNGSLFPMASISILKTNVTTYTAITPSGQTPNLTAANTTLNGTTYPDLATLFAAFKTSLF